MNRARPLAFLTAFLCLTGCRAQDRVDAPVRRVVQTEVEPGDIRGGFEADLRQLLATRAPKDQVLKGLGDRNERVPNEAFWKTFYQSDEHLPHVPPGVRAEVKRYYRVSTETYVVYGEDESTMIVYFDKSGRLWHYEHL